MGYVRKVKRQEGKRHRRWSDTKKERLMKKLSGKTSWFKKRYAGKKTDTPKTGGADRNHWKRKEKETGGKRMETDRKTPSAVIFIPRTSGGELMKIIREKEQELSKHTLQTVKVVERNGSKLEHLLVKVDPVGEGLCERPECFSCLTSDKDNSKCRQTNIVYKVDCKLCGRNREKVQ